MSEGPSRFLVWVTHWDRVPKRGACLRRKTLGFMLDKSSGWPLWASWLDMPAEGEPYRLEALGQTSPPRTVDCGGCGTLGFTCSAKEGSPVRGALEEPWGQCHISGRQGNRSGRWGRSSGGRVPGAPAEKLGRGGFLDRAG